MNELLNVVGMYVPIGALAALVAAAATPLAIIAARRFDVMDHPDQVLKPHARPTPYLGGAAIACGWLVGVVVAVWRGLLELPEVAPILGGGLLIAVLGLADDVRHIPAKLRLALSGLIVLAVMWFGDVGLGLADVVAQEFGIVLPSALGRALSLLLGAFVVLGACNATNLIDGLDGLCAGTKAVIAFGFFALAAYLAADQPNARDALRLALAIAMCGSAIGFLLWNFNPARIFMGDTGSLLLGFLSGMLILLFADQGTLRWVLGALMIFTLPVFDAALAMTRRWRSGKPIFEGDRSHFYDQLVQRGYSVRQTALICYAVALLFVVVGLFVIPLSGRAALALFVAVAIVTAVLANVAGFTRPPKAGSA